MYNTYSDLPKDVIVGDDSLIGKSVTMGNNCVIGANCIIDDNVWIGDNVIISNDTILRSSVRIGNNCCIGDIDHPEHKTRNNINKRRVIIGTNSHIGDNCTLRNGVTLGVLSKLFYGVYIGIGGRISKYNTIGNNCVIGDYVRVLELTIIASYTNIPNDAYVKCNKVIVTNDIINKDVFDRVCRYIRCVMRTVLS